MTYAYGTKGAPAVGSGLPGLPRRAALPASGYPIGSIVPGPAPKVGEWVETLGQTIDLSTIKSSITSGDRIGYLSWSADGKFLAGIGDDANIPPKHRYWILKRTGETLQSAWLHQPGSLGANAAAWCPTAPLWVVTRNYGDVGPLERIRLNPDDTFDILPPLADIPTAAAYGCAWNPEGDLLVIGSRVSSPGFLLSRNGENLSFESAFPGGAQSSLDVAWSPDGKYIAITMNADPYLLLFGFDNGVLTQLSCDSLTGSPRSGTLSWSADSRYLAVAVSTSNVNLLELVGDALVRRQILSGSSAGITSNILQLRWSPKEVNSLALAFGQPSDSRGLRWGIVEKGTLFLSAIPGFHPAGSINVCNGVAFTPDGKFLASSSSGSSGTRDRVTLWGSEETTYLPNLPGHFARVA